MSELKPCPFCGKEREKPLLRKNNDDDMDCVWCVICGARGPERVTKKEAVAAWNERVTDVQKPKRRRA